MNKDEQGAATDAGAAADGIRFIIEYQYENDLLTDFARLQAGRGRQAQELIVAALLICGGGLALTTAGSNPLGWLGLLLIACGLYLVWHAKNLRHIMARHFIDAMERDPGSFGNRYRRIAASDAGVMVFAHDGRSRYYPWEKLKRTLADDRMIVLVFGDEGVAVPRDAFAQGTSAEFEVFLGALKR